MPVELTSPVEGKAVGEKYSGDREDWLVEQGYAKRLSGDAEQERGDSPEVKDKQPSVKGDFRYATSVGADRDPTLAANREAPNEPTPHEADPSVTGPAATQQPSVEQTRGRPDPSTIVPVESNEEADKRERKAAKKAAKEQRKSQEEAATDS